MKIRGLGSRFQAVLNYEFIEWDVIEQGYVDRPTINDIIWERNSHWHFWWPQPRTWGICVVSIATIG